MKARRYAIYAAVAIFGACATMPIAFSSPGGKTGSTRLNSTKGCGGCHGSTATTSVVVSITGPASMTPGQTSQFQVTVTGTSGSAGGVNIAVSAGTLAPVSTFLQKSGSELTHNARVAVPSTYLFNYTAPASQGSVTMYATGKDNAMTQWNWAPDKQITVVPLAGIEDAATLPGSFALGQNYPNPFNPSTSISYQLSTDSQVKLLVYDLLGNEVATLANGVQAAGTHTVRFYATALASGVYLYRLEAVPMSVRPGAKTVTFTETNKLIPLR